MARASETFYLNVAANTTRQSFTLTPKKKADTLKLYTVFAGQSTAKVLIELYLSGNFVASWDGSRFAAGNQPVHVEATITPDMTITVYVTDQNGTGNSLFPFTLSYDDTATA